MGAALAGEEGPTDVLSRRITSIMQSHAAVMSLTPCLGHSPTENNQRLKFRCGRDRRRLRSVRFGVLPKFSDVVVSRAMTHLKLKRRTHVDTV